MLVGVELALREVRRLDVAVIFLLRDFGFVRQRLHALQVRLGFVVARLALCDVGLGKREVGGGGFLVGEPGAHGVGLCSGNYAVRGGRRHRHNAGGALRLALGERERGARLLDFRFIVARIDADEHLSGLNLRIVQHQDFGDAAVNFRGHRRDVRFDLRVVGRDAIAVVEIETRHQHQQTGRRRRSAIFFRLPFGRGASSFFSAAGGSGAGFWSNSRVSMFVCSLSLCIQ